MPSEAGQLVDSDAAYPVVRLSRIPVDAAAFAVRDALLDVLAGQPEALVIDVAGADHHFVHEMRHLALGRMNEPASTTSP